MKTIMLYVTLFIYNIVIANTIPAHSLNLCEFNSCVVTILDVNFKSALVNNGNINTNGDTEIQCSEAAAYSFILNLGNLNISDLTGVEAFTSIPELRASNNQITSLDLTGMTAIEKVIVNDNQINTITISGTPNLKDLQLKNNQLATIDLTNVSSLESLIVSENVLTALDVSNNPGLLGLACDNNSLSSLDVTSNTNLTQLFCNNNTISFLNITNLTNLNRLFCQFNSLVDLDISTNTGLQELLANDNSLNALDTSNAVLLEQLFIQNNNIFSIDLTNSPNLFVLYCSNNIFNTLNVTNNINLQAIVCDNNDLTALDLSFNSVLVGAICNDNNLSSLTIANGNNTNIMNANFVVTNNPNLLCIEVDNVAYSDANWTNKDAVASYGTNCATLSVSTFAIETIAVYPNPVKHTLNIAIPTELNTISIYTLDGKEVLKTKYKSIAVSNLQSGVYLIKIEDVSGKQFTKRFVKQ